MGILGLEQLLQLINSVYGYFMEPRKERKMAEARIEAIDRTSAQISRIAERDNTEIGVLDGKIAVRTRSTNQEISLEDRADARVRSIEVTRESNLDSVFSKTYQNLVETPLTEEPTGKVDESWFTRFVDAAKDVSDNDLQDLWSRILRGQIETPGRYSLRAIDILKNFSKADAETFLRICKYLIADRDSSFLIKQSNGKYPFGLRYQDVIDMVDAGLMHPIATTYSWKGPSRLVPLKGSVADYILEVPLGHTLHLEIHHTSRAGHELFRLTDVPPEPTYLDPLIELAKLQNSSLREVKNLRDKEGMLYFDVVRTLA